jgi:phage tail-like protein
MMPDPLPAYRFVVTLDPADAYLPPAQAALVTLVALGQFQEVKGLGADLEVMAYPEGGMNGFVHQLPVRHSWNRLSLRRGLLTDLGLWFWYQAGLTQSLGARRDGAVLLLSQSGLPAMAWTFRAGLAVKWSGPELNAMQSAVAIEGLEIAHEGLEQIPIPLSL